MHVHYKSGAGVLYNKYNFIRQLDRLPVVYKHWQHIPAIRSVFLFYNAWR